MQDICKYKILFDIICSPCVYNPVGISTLHDLPMWAAELGNAGALSPRSPGLSWDVSGDHGMEYHCDSLCMEAINFSPPKRQRA